MLASTLATTAGSEQADDPRCKPSLGLEDAKMLGAAATLGGAAGMLLMGPLAAASLGGMAAYATTKEDPAGLAARKVCTTSLGIADCAVNKAMGSGLKAVEFTLEEGRRRLLEGINSPASPGKQSVIMDWCRANKDKCIRAVAAVEALQRTLPRRKLSEEAQRMKTRYPDRVPVLCERCAGARSDLPDIERKKFVVPHSMLFGEFKYIVHKQVAQAARGLPVDETIYLFVGEPGLQPKTSATMGDLAKSHGSEDGFLYVRYTAENTLGRSP
jgi:GABA(A) receptor-associated protein